MSNLHLNLDEANKHTPKGFDNAASNTRPWKDESSQSTYTDNETLPRALNFVDGTTAPPTTTNGHIYVITGTGTVNAGWGSASFNDWVRFANGFPVSISPVTGYLCYDVTASQWMEFDGSTWAVFGGGGTNFADVLFVDPNGNDGTGAKGDNSKPFLTLEAARDAASTGDTILVNSGSYTVTTTSFNGLAVDGVKYFFQSGSVVTKSTSGHLFNLDGFTTGFNIYGYGDFTTTFAGSRVWNWTSGGGFDPIFQGRDLVSTSASSIEYRELNQTVTYNFRDVTSGSGSAFFLRNNGSFKTPKISITANTIKSTAGVAIDVSKNYIGSTISVSAAVIQSTSTYAISISSTESNINVKAGAILGINGGGYAVNQTGLGSRLLLNCPFTSGVLATGDSYTRINGEVRELAMTQNAKVNADFLSYRLTQSGGELITSMASANVGFSFHTPIITITGGLATIIGCRVFDNSGFFLNVSGGKLIMDGHWETVNDRYDRTISGTGEVIFNANFVMNGGNYQKPILALTGGKLTLNSSAKLTHSGTGISNAPILFDGGELICNGGTLITTATEAPPISVTNGAKNIRVLTGGLNTNVTANGGTLAGNKQKNNETVQSVAITTITLNDGTGGNEVFTETDTATYSTVDLMAARMADLINLSGTLDVTAIYVSGDSFDWESGISGTPITRVSGVNLLPLVLRLNSYPMTNIIGGNIIDNVNVI